MTYQRLDVGNSGLTNMDIVAGGGKYGSYAVEFLKEEDRGFVVVDTDSNCLVVKKFGLQPPTNFDHEGEYFIKGDLKTVLGLLLTAKAEFVFPTVPTHLGADLARIKFSLKPWIEGISNILPKMPQEVVVKAREGNLVATFNKNYQCIDKCAMPKVCPSSGFEKTCTMTELMRSAAPHAFFLLSHSMAPGLGALKGTELAEFFSWAEKKRKLVVATTCDCHGVLTALQK